MLRHRAGQFIAGLSSGKVSLASVWDAHSGPEFHMPARAVA